ncbi:leucyl aminopeptidase [Chondromyces crocatus]|uniref:Probable cytosol aminopeptidase n=1 Tax=Chondromyces crocatus TaxID=52 RepID=A0A0K1EM04_CHOCO|nr:leucyl aminopeptidase [Chondromyces crocatus]AKT41861.1 cytosol aminopeptidase [Chondromyces crocatus]
MPIKIQIASSDPLSTPADVLVVGVPEGAALSESVFSRLQESLGEAVSRQLKRDDFTGKKDQSVEFTTYERIKPARVLVLGMGKGPFSDADVRLLAARGARFATGARAQSITLSVPEGIAGAERAAAEGLVLGSYRFTRYFTGDRLPKTTLERGSVLVQGKVTKAGRDAVALGQQIGESVCIARDLINEPPNELYPEAFARFATTVGKQRGLKVTVFDKAALTKRGMKLMLAVGQGSARDPRLIHMAYVPKGKPKAKLVFVGKGLTFDSGGLCIKPAPGMEEMKGDMGGAANVVALMAAIAALKPAVEVHGIIGAAENMPDGDAYRPGDIFGSLDGKTVEIINTDAEGRLVLADCLAYARTLKPDLILDNATLTGACVVALGTTVSAFFANRDELADRMRAAARTAGESMWQMPLVEELRDGLKSEWADLKHTADRWGGAITAALFLREFVGDIPWIHVDVAGPSMASKPYGIYTKGGTGHGVLTFLRLVESYAR